MPNKPTKPRVPGRRLPKGTTRDDYAPEVLAEFDRNNWRVSKAKHRSRKRHAGYRDVSFFLDRATREGLATLAKAAGTTRSAVITALVQEKTHG